MLKYGLLGGGMMGQEHIQNVALIPDAEVTAIAEPNQEMQSRCLGLVPNAAMTNSLDELLKEDIDALVIATPNFQHADQLIQTMAHKTLPILVENLWSPRQRTFTGLPRQQRNIGRPFGLPWNIATCHLWQNSVSSFLLSVICIL